MSNKSKSFWEEYKVYDASMKLSYFDGETVDGVPVDCPPGTDKEECYFFVDGIGYNFWEEHFTDESIPARWTAHIKTIVPTAVIKAGD